MKKIALLLTCLLAACSSKSGNSSDDLVSIQILDRNGFSETISARERLVVYEETDFAAPQPYQKVVRVYGKSSLGKTSSKVTTYHANGQPWQYLEIENGRAHGKFFEWHPNGKLKIDAVVIEGTPDITPTAQVTWLFDETSHVFDEEQHLIAQIPYDKGQLHGVSRYFHPDGTDFKEIPYHKDLIDGIVKLYDVNGKCIEKIPYNKGEKDGHALAYWKEGSFKYREIYDNGKLMRAEYFNAQGEKVAGIENGSGEQAIFEKEHLKTLIEHHRGIVDGAVKHFDNQGNLFALFHIKDGMKDGDEWEYHFDENHPKLHLQWVSDVIQGVAKTWYESGILESQREMNDNKKHGLSFAWYRDGDLMLMEEYENDLLIKGSYFKKWEKNPTSKIDNGKGVATLFDADGRFLKKITYEKGVPVDDQ